MSREESPESVAGKFPKGFRFGAAASAFQIEGSLDADGRGESVWDVFCRRPGKVERGEDASEACAHYRLWREDIALMAGMGLESYRFSLAWPRILPEGRGRVETRGLDFYSRLVDALLEAGIRPLATLYHWDLPVSLWENHGGWLGRETAEAFAEYADVAFRALGDRVPDWVLLNEPANIHAHGSYGMEVHAPGAGRGFDGLVLAAHHQLLGYGLARQAIRQAGQGGARVGLGEAYSPIAPSANGASEDLLRRAEHFHYGWYTDVLRTGRYPLLDEIPALAERLPGGFDEDCRLVQREGCDFFGINYYTGKWIEPDDALPGWKNGPPPEGVVSETNGLGWPVYPEGFSLVVDEIARRLPGTPLIVLENGYCDELAPPASGDPVEDLGRTEFLSRHLDALAQSVASGAPVEAYYHWSLMDNFEWAKGYAPRFGLVSVDYPTQRRSLKQSGRWYRDLLAARRAAGLGG